MLFVKEGEKQMLKGKKAKWCMEENTRERFTRYSIRKYSVGVASVAVLSGFFFLSGASVQASDIVAPQIPKQETVTTINTLTGRSENKEVTDKIEKNINSERSKEESDSNINLSVNKENESEVTNRNRSTRRVRESGNNPDEASPTGQPTTQPTTNQPSGSQPSSNQPDSSNKYLGTEITAYFDNNGNGKYDPGIDELIDKTVVPPAENGAAGKDGRNGAELLSGVIAPTPEDGKDGDTYIDATTGDVYKKSNGTWNKIGNLRGPQGEKGQKGDKGENGKDGRAPKIKVEDIAKSTELAGVLSRSGIRITVYDDKNNNDEFDEGDTVLNTKDVYNGTDGRNGVDGQTPKVKAVRDEAKKQTTLTFYIDKDGDGNYTEGTDTLVQTSIVKDGQDGATGQSGRDGKEVLNGKIDPQPRDGKDGDTFVNTATGDIFVKKNNAWEQAGNIKGPQGAKGDKGENGKDGFTPEVTVTDNHDGTHTITIIQPEGRPALTTTVKNGVDGQTPKVKAVRDEAKKQTTLTFYIDKDGDGNYTEGTDTLVQTSIVKDGQDGATGQAGRDGKEVLNGKVDPTPRDGKDGDTFVNTATGDVFVKKNNTWEQAGNIKGPKGDKGENGKDGFTPEVKVTDNHDGTHTITITQPEGRPALTTTVKNGVDGQTPKVKAVRDEAKKQTTLTFYIDKDGDGNYTEGTDILVQTSIVKDGQDGAAGQTGRDGKEVLNGKVDPTPRDGKDGDTFVNTATGDVFVKKNNTWEQAGNIKGPKGDKGENGKDGFTPEVTITDNHDGTQTITITQPEGRPSLTTTVKNGVDGQTPKVKAVRDEAKKQTTLTFYIDKDGDGNYTEGTDTLVQTSIVKDGQDGRDGKSLITVKEGKETKVYQEDPTHPGQPLTPDRPLAVIRDGIDGKTPTVTAARKEELDHNGVEITVDNHDGSQPTKVFVHDGEKGENGQDGKTPTVTTQRGSDGHSTVVTITTPGKEPVTFTVRDGLDGHDGRAPKIDLKPFNHAVESFRSARVSRSSGNNSEEENSNEINQPISNEHTSTGTHVTAYYDNNGNDVYDPGVDDLISERDVLDGNDGVDGNRGRDGRNGAELLSGNIAPTSTDGKNGDTYIDSNTGDVYKKNNGNWDKIGNIRGPQGLTGERGEKGERGDKGEKGADGKSPSITVTDNGDGTHSITVRNLDGSESTTKIKDGKDGKTATITTTENPDGSHTITVTNPDGTIKETVVKNGKDGKTPKVEVTDNNDGTHTIKVTDGEGNVTNAIIKDGKDGKAATATTTENQDGSHTVTITNPDGTKNEFVVKNGRDGVDGRTPTASVRDNGDGSHTIVITNPEGVTTETTVRDGKSPKVTITDEQNGTHKISVLNGDGTTTETIIKDGKSPVATVTDNHDGTYTIRVENGNGTISETTIRDGKSPSAKVVDNGDGTHTVTIVNSDGTTTTTTVRDGKSPKLEVIDNHNGSHTIKVTGTDGKETSTTIFDGKSPKANIVNNGDGTHTLTIVDSDGREYKSIIKDGKDGVSPTVSVKNNNDGTHVVTITNPDGGKTEMVIKDGKDGKSPKVSVEDNGDGSHIITIINSDGTVTKTVIKDGKDGRDGRDGKDGKCGCQEKPVTPSNNKPVPPVNHKQEEPMFAMPEPPVFELPELDLPGMPTPPVYEVPELNIPTPSDNGNVPPVNEVPREGKVPSTNGITPPPTEVSREKEVSTEKTPEPEIQTGTITPNSYLPETGTQSDYIYIILASGILMSLYIGKRQED